MQYPYMQLEISEIFDFYLNLFLQKIQAGVFNFPCFLDAFTFIGEYPLNEPDYPECIFAENILNPHSRICTHKEMTI